MSEFKIAYPVKPLHINQGFGENPAMYAQFGINGHNGIDFSAVHGQPVYASHDGMAKYEVDDSQGDGFVIISNDSYDHNGQQVHFKSIYWHLCPSDSKNPHYDSKLLPVLPTDGSWTSVKCGDLIGYADSTGFSTGDHLHFGLKACVPGTPPASGDTPDVLSGNWVNLNQDNGFKGAIDPTPYFSGSFAQDLLLPSQKVADMALVAPPLQKSLLEAISALLRAFGS